MVGVSDRVWYVSVSDCVHVVCAFASAVASGLQGWREIL